MVKNKILILFNFIFQTGGIYVYSNLKGCDGERVYYDGASMIFANTKMVAQGNQFSIDEVEMVTATVDLDDIYPARHGTSFGLQVSRNSKTYPKIRCDMTLCHADGLTTPLSPVISPTICKPEEEIANGPACWLWDYLRRSGCNGFFLPLSGGLYFIHRLLSKSDMVQSGHFYKTDRNFCVESLRRFHCIFFLLLSNLYLMICICFPNLRC